MGERRYWAIVRRVVIVDGELRELNISFGQYAVPLSHGVNLTTMTYSNDITENGHHVYLELAYLAEAQFQTLYH